MLKNKRFIKISVIAIMTIIIGCIAKNQNTFEKTSSVSAGAQFSYSNWGKALREIDNKEQRKSLNRDSNIILQGNSEAAAVTEPEYERSVSFYQIAGLSQKEAQAAALEECKKTAALYAEAKRRGFDVTDGEVRDYVYNELRPFIKTADNSDDFAVILSGFGSEEDYWELQCQIYKKLLPIQQMAERLQQEYSIKTGISRYEMKFSQKFKEYYQEFQKNLVSKENFR